MALPNFIIVGAAKAGTTALYYHLKQHPEIFLPENKEPHFFSHYKLSKKDFKAYTNPYKVVHIVRSWKEYQKLFKDAGKPAIGDMSTSYLFIHERSVMHIKELVGKPKIIIFLRNPLQSCLSHYNMIASGLNDDATFEEAFADDARRIRDHNFQQSHFARFLYYKQVKDYMDNFDVKIFYYEDFTKEPQKVLDELCDHLGISRFTPKMDHHNVTQYPNTFFWHVLRKSGIAKGIYLFPHPARKWMKKNLSFLVYNESKPQMTPDMKKKLIKFYKNDIEKLSKLIGKDLTYWLQ
jgi:hypothetical protein